MSKTGTLSFTTSEDAEHRHQRHIGKKELLRWRLGLGLGNSVETWQQCRNFNNFMIEIPKLTMCLVSTFTLSISCRMWPNGCDAAAFDVLLCNKMYITPQKSVCTYPNSAVLSMDCIWDCSLFPFKGIDLSCNTRHNPYTRAVWFLEEMESCIFCDPRLHF